MLTSHAYGLNQCVTDPSSPAYPSVPNMVSLAASRGEVSQIGNPTRVRNPQTVDYHWYPNLSRTDLGIGTTTAYWVQNLAARTTTPGQVASVDATSAAIPDPAISVSKTGPTVSTAGPTPALVTDQTWTTGAKPAAAQHLSLSSGPSSY